MKLLPKTEWTVEWHEGKSFIMSLCENSGYRNFFKFEVPDLPDDLVLFLNKEEHGSKLPEKTNGM